MGNPFFPEYMVLGDDFPSGGRPPPGADGGPVSEWGMLARGQTLGKRINIGYAGISIIGDATPSLNMFEVKGADEYALQLSVQLSPPRVFPNGSPPAAQLQNASGTVDNIQAFDQGLGIGWAEPFAIVEWGIGGVSNRCEADILNGLHLNVSASWLRIGAAIQSPEALTTTTAYEISAFVGPGRPKDNNAQRSIQVNGAAGGVGSQSAAFPIPRYAKRVYLMGCNAAFDVYVGKLRFWRETALGAGAELGEYIFAGNSPSPLPIPNGAYYFTVVNGIDAAQNYAVFELSI